ncbi:MAG TPA: transketolase C-terminal domain-containing protein [Candidatus Levybacteria bacterium]|nr:transketolase C-terminal domain-containing protein [Candidatus Levybacteria bacterium]
MLNPVLKLNPKLFDENVEKDATRSGYGTGLIKLGDTNPNVVALCADLTDSTKVEAFAKKYSDRYFEVGVAEQNMAAIAAGLGVSGKIPFISSYATFSPGRNWEQIRTTIVYNDANAKIAGHHAGIMTGPDGATHQATEDIAITRVWPNIRVFVPCDALEGERATILAGNVMGPVYMRFTRDKTPIITTSETPFEEGKAYVYWIGENPQVSLFATGYMLYYALMAAKQLAEEGINTEVLNIASIKPLDRESVIESVKKTRAAVSVEDHQVAGGLGGLLAEIFSEQLPTPLERIGLQDIFGESGKPDELLKKYHMDTPDIITSVKKVISRK